MEITIKGEAKEIADLVDLVQGRRHIRWDPSGSGIKAFSNILLTRHDTEPEARESRPDEGGRV